MINPLEGLLIGRTLCDRYRIEEVIGRGGMSAVYRAFDQRLGRPVALKVVSLPARERSVDEMRARLRREAASAARIPAHPNVVHIYDYGTDEELDLDFIVMELLSGRDLKAAIRAGELTMAESARVLRDAARGIAAGHAAGIVHRDVKPANIFLTGDAGVGSVKILDFGIAKALEVEPEDDLTRADPAPHSPAYASPEQARGDVSPGPASDVYQLGLVAYELLAGERPFTEEDRARLARGERVPLPTPGRWGDVPRALRDAVATALQPRPADRYRDGAAFAEALAAAGIPHQRSEGPPSSSAPAGHRHPARSEGPPDPSAPAAHRHPERSEGPPDPRAPAAHRHPERSEGPPDPRAGAPSEETALAPDIARSFTGGIPGDDETRAYDSHPPTPGDRSTPPVGSPATVGDAAPGASRRPPARALQLTGAAALALLGLWAIVQLGRGSDASTADAADVDIAALHEEFRPIIEKAAARQLAAAANDEADAAAEVERVILDMNQAWVRGDLDRHIAHYADRVDFYNSYGAPRAYIARERGNALERYSEREITITRTATTFPRPDRARALIDKSWRFSGGDDEWSGSARQELILERINGVWQVVSERDERVF